MRLLTDYGVLYALNFLNSIRSSVRTSTRIPFSQFFYPTKSTQLRCLSSTPTIPIQKVVEALLPLYKGSIPTMVGSVAKVRLMQLFSRLDRSCPPGDTFTIWEELNVVLNGMVPPPNRNTTWLEHQTIQQVQTLFEQDPPPLLVGGFLKDTYIEREFIRNPTEWYWSRYPILFPFPSNPNSLVTGHHNITALLKKFDDKQDYRVTTLPEHQELMNLILSNSPEDALAAIFLVSPFLDRSNVLIHDIGCWNGYNLQNMQVYAMLRGKHCPIGLGTDINLPSLNVAKTFAETSGIGTHSHYYVANALDPLILSSLNIPAEYVIKVALRLIPVLDLPSAKQFLSTLRDSLHSGSVAIMSFPVPEGANYQISIEQSSINSDVRIEKFLGGVTIKKNLQLQQLRNQFNGDSEVVVNTYYTLEGFCELASECGLRVVRNILVGESTDNCRYVVLLNKI